MLPDGTIAKCDGRFLRFLFADPDDPRFMRQYTTRTDGFRLRLSSSKDARGIETTFHTEGTIFNNHMIEMTAPPRGEDR